MILLSDGKRTEGSDPLAAAQRAKQLGIPVSTVALGTADGTVLRAARARRIPVPPDPRDAAGDQPHHRRHVHRGRRRRRSSTSVYKKLGSKIGTKRVKREVSSSFAAAGLRPAARPGSARGLRWRGRLP